ncbi:MAG TPA: RNA methyltransferase [Flavihumibacter sp.]|jgi:TrmH family RNA methyltransferase
MITKNQAKYIQSLSHKKFRDEEGVFVAEAPKTVSELIGLPHMRPRFVFGLEEWWSQHPSWKAESWAHTISADELERISFLKTPNQVLAVFQKPDLETVPGAWQLLLDGIQDPGNMGTIIRIADWFGIQQIICSEDCADAFNPKVVQSTMASIGRVELIYTDLVAYVKAHPHRDFIAATLDGSPVRSSKVHHPASLVIGNESRGIRPELKGLLRHFVTIPRIGQAESLNAAVATGILLSHLADAEPHGTKHK